MLDLNDIIGNTPMIKINYCYNGKKKYVYAKLEFYNITGSIKDRVALYMIKNAEESGKLKKKWELSRLPAEIQELHLQQLEKDLNIQFIFLCLIG